MSKLQTQEQMEAARLKLLAEALALAMLERDIIDPPSPSLSPHYKVQAQAARLLAQAQVDVAQALFDDAVAQMVHRRKLAHINANMGESS